MTDFFEALADAWLTRQAFVVISHKHKILETGLCCRCFGTSVHAGLLHRVNVRSMCKSFEPKQLKRLVKEVPWWIFDCAEWLRMVNCLVLKYCSFSVCSWWFSFWVAYLSSCFLSLLWLQYWNQIFSQNTQTGVLMLMAPLKAMR